MKPVLFPDVMTAPQRESLKHFRNIGLYGAVPKSKASAPPPVEPLKISLPTPPARFSAAKKAHAHDDHAGCQYPVHGAWLCHTGRVRMGNEDAVLAGPKCFVGCTDEPSKISLSKGPWIVAVSDGIGGHRGGAEASSGVVHALAKCPRVTPVSVTDILDKLNREFCERGHFDPDLMAMGATVAGIGCGGR